MSAVPPDAYLPQYSVEEETDPDERLKVVLGFNVIPKGSSTHVYSYYKVSSVLLHVHFIVWIARRLQGLCD